MIQLNILFNILFHYGFSYFFLLHFLAEYWTSFPVLYIRTLFLSILCIKACICKSQFIPLPSTSPLATTSLFCMYLILFLFHRWVHLCHISDCTYKRYHIFLLLCLTSHSKIVYRFICVVAMALFHSFLWLSNFHHIYVPHLLDPFICWWTLRLLPCLSYCKQCYNEHYGACILSNHAFFSRCMPRSGIARQ